ncbi:hypothetical protein PITCH_A240003 [uncultured Desulfobacterium sp.]|uniref:Uncharacterized protein n=1 Tax=uncultured Desulfobacterium sp. TaxID=201089 RepID=A0A445MYU5_9BACT|nr:hypothetical protein PITCH_A240003 [uncultured Desulfobacterium sp.]
MVIASALDTLHERHGYKSVCPGALIDRKNIIDKKDRRLTSKIWRIYRTIV